MIKGLTEFIFPPVYRVQMKSDVGNVGELTITVCPILEKYVLLSTPATYNKILY